MNDEFLTDVTQKIDYQFSIIFLCNICEKFNF